MTDLEHVLEHTEAVWRELDGARIFITGGTGFLGRSLLESLAGACSKLGVKIEAVVLTRSVQAAEKKFSGLDARIRFVPGDVGDFEFPSGQFSHFIHGAASPGDRGSLARSSHLAATLDQGTRRVLELAGRSPRSRFLLVSSGAVYSKQVAVYDEGKRLSEALCLQAGQEGKTEPVLARCFSFVGPGIPFDGSYAIGNFIRDGKAGGPVRVQGDGTALRSYLYTADFAVWLWTLLLRGRSNSAYDVGSDETVSVGKLAQQIAGFYGCRVETARPEVAHAVVDRYVPLDLAPAHALGLRTWIALTEAILRTDQSLESA